MAEPPCVLIIDDEAHIRELLHDTLQSFGYAPKTSANGLDGLAIIRQQPPDAVLLDVMMPFKDGIQVLEELKADSRLRVIPVIVMSAFDDMTRIERCLTLGADDYLVKPLNLSLLKARLEGSLKRLGIVRAAEESRRQLEAYVLELASNKDNDKNTVSSKRSDSTLQPRPLSKDDPSQPAPPGDSPLPRFLRDYELLERLGSGGMGTVHRARHVHLDKIFALKVLRPEIMFNSRSVERFRREMRAVGKLSHPNIVAATDAGEVAGVHFLVMEFVAGLDLAAVLKRRGPLEVAAACEIIRQAATGLQHAHAAGMIHRDIKPSNFILSNDGTVKLLDLGLARLQESAGDLTGGDWLGTPDFMSPEQVEGKGTVESSTDVYSLGCTFYMLLNGEAPYAHHKLMYA
jgi:DNA-binding response OmpR family regulator